MVKMSKIHTHHTEKDNSRDGSFKKFRKLNLLTFYKSTQIVPEKMRLFYVPRVTSAFG